MHAASVCIIKESDICLSPLLIPQLMPPSLAPVLQSPAVACMMHVGQRQIVPHQLLWSQVAVCRLPPAFHDLYRQLIRSMPNVPEFVTQTFLLLLSGVQRDAHPVTGHGCKTIERSRHGTTTEKSLREKVVRFFHDIINLVTIYF